MTKISTLCRARRHESNATWTTRIRRKTNKQRRKNDGWQNCKYVLFYLGCVVPNVESMSMADCCRCCTYAGGRGRASAGTSCRLVTRPCPRWRSGVAGGQRRWWLGRPWWFLAGEEKRTWRTIKRWWIVANKYTTEKRTTREISEWKRNSSEMSEVAGKARWTFVGSLPERKLYTMKFGEGWRELRAAARDGGF
jgi:hypothetical protein